MKHILLSLILLLMFSACTDDSAQYEKKIKELSESLQIVESEKNALFSETKAKDEALKEAQSALIHAKKQLQIQQEKLIQLQKKEAKKNVLPQHEKLSNVGITIEENKITLDTDKTKDFFNNIAQELTAKLQKVTQDIKEGSLSQKDTGIQIDNNHINIDLNKTKDFLQAWGEQIQGFAQEFDDIAQEFNLESDKINYTK